MSSWRKGETLMNKQNDVTIYLDRGDKLCYQIKEYVRENHADWKLIDSSDTVNDYELWDSFEQLCLKRFPVIRLDGKVLRFQPVSLDEMIKYLEQRESLHASEQLNLADGDGTSRCGTTEPGRGWDIPQRKLSTSQTGMGHPAHRSAKVIGGDETSRRGKI